MPKKKQKLPPARTDTQFAYRASSRLEGGEGDALPIVLGTETPVRVFDFKNRQIVDEVLLMRGLELPQQVPLLNSHRKDEARDVIGSIRDLEIRNEELVGNVYFANSESAQEIRGLYEEGHLTDFSIGFEPFEIKRIREKQKTIGGRTFEAPVNVVTRSKVREGSAVAIGADENAKAKQSPALRAYLNPDSLYEDSQMDMLRDLALTRGMPADLTEPEEVFEWVKNHLFLEPPKSDRNADDPPDDPDPDPDDVEDAVDQRKRAADIVLLCDRQGLSSERAASYIASSLSAAEVALDILKNRQPSAPIGNPGVIEAGEASVDKIVSGCTGALTARCIGNMNIDRAEKQANGQYEDYAGELHQTHSRDILARRRVSDIKETIENPHSHDFQTLSLCDMARIFVRAGGIDVDRMNRKDVVRQAFSMNLHQRDAAYHTTGTFANVLLDAANKTLLMAYDEAAVTYPLWVRTAPSAPDYKDLKRIRLGEIPDPTIVPENSPYGESPVSDNKETYHVEKYGNIFSISLEAVVNDDLNAISRIPAMQGNAMRRKVNKVCYAVLTANAALSDSIALFHATSHNANLDAVALSATSVQTGFTVMMTQTGIDSGTTLNIIPRYLIVPAALAHTALQLVMSTADPTSASASTEDAARPGFNSGVVNLYGPNGPRRLVPVIDAVLDGTSATGWYMAAEPGQIDTVEVTFLQGEEAPVLEREIGFTVDAVRYKVRQSFAAKAIDYRGLYQGNA